MMDASKQDLIAELDMLLTSAQLQEAWEAQRSLTSLPNVVFRAEGYRVVMHFYSHRGSLPGLQEIKRSFTMAMRRKGAFPSCRIQWLN
jgi:hypothetical protein